jgi:competence protein ComEC
LLWARPIAARLASLPRWIALGFGATLAAQFAVMPLIAGLFGNISLAAPAANVLALPAVPPATVLGLAAAVTGAIHPGTGRAVAAAAEPFVAWIVWVAHVFGGRTWSAIAVPPWTAWPLAAVVVIAALRTAAARRPTLGSLE